MRSSPNFWGNLIAQLRSEQGISQRQLAAGVHVNRGTLRRIEDGSTTGDIETVEKVLNFLGYELDAMEAIPEADRLKKQAEMVADPGTQSRLSAARILALRL